MAKLTILTGTSAGQAFTFNRAIRIGRMSDNALVIKNPTISSYHAEIILRNQQLFLCDLGSTNGTSLNGVPLHAHTYVRLNHGDEVGFANYVLRFEQDDNRQSMSSVSGQFAAQKERAELRDSTKTIQICSKCGQPRHGTPPQCGCTPRPEQVAQPITFAPAVPPQAAAPDPDIDSPASGASSEQDRASESSRASQSDSQLEAVEKEEMHTWLWAGILTVVLSTLWFGVSLALGVLFLYPVFIFGVGGYAIYRGLPVTRQSAHS